MTTVHAGSATDTGLVRRNNQDHLLVTDTIFAVADGMGGHAGGEVASRVAVEALHTYFDEHHGDPATTDDLVQSVHAANLAVYERAQSDSALRGMGTTITAAALVVDEGEEHIAIANVGDSRAYVFYHGDLTQLTEDHSVAEELVRQGQLDPGEVDSHPQRHILTRAMGILPEVEVDLWEVLPFTGDRIVLCSDGLVREVTDEQIAAVLRRLADPTEAAQELVARARSAGGSDNITVVVIDVADDGGRSRAASADAAALGPEPGPATTVAAMGNTPAAAPATFPTASPAPPPAASTPVVKRRRVTLRVLLFVLVLCAVFGGAAVAVVTYARSSYYVTLGAPGSVPSSPLIDASARPLVILRGRPGGILWLHPTLVEVTGVLSTQVLPAHLPDLAKGKLVAGTAAGRDYVANLRSEAAAAAPSPPTTAFGVPSPTNAPTAPGAPPTTGRGP